MLFSNLKWNTCILMASVIQYLVSHDPLQNILIWWFGAQETLNIFLSMLRVVLLNIFVKAVIIFFLQDSLMDRTLKKHF